jgi:hypothetical protein
MANLLSQENVMSCMRRGVDCRKKASQYLSLILRKNSLLLVLCLFLGICIGKLPSNFISLETDFVWLPKQMTYTQLIFQDTAAISLRVLCLSEFIITRTSPSSEMKQDSIQVTKVYVIRMWTPKEQLQKQTAWVHIPLCEGIILQKRFEKKSNWIFQNLGENV